MYSVSQWLIEQVSNNCIQLSLNAQTKIELANQYYCVTQKCFNDKSVLKVFLSGCSRETRDLCKNDNQAKHEKNHSDCCWHENCVKLL